MEKFDLIYSVSDLHLGGGLGLQIFRRGELLGATFRHIAAVAGGANKRVALVLNGDVVDFLAEEGATYFNPKEGPDWLARIAEDHAFKPVFEGLAAVVRAGGTVVVVLGNHDLELTLPPCREWLIRRLGGDDPKARGRVVLALDGSGFRCEVGDATAWFVHGNDWDTWNRVDHDALGDPARHDAMRINDGTRLVIDVMNPIKRAHRFVDLLKPEGLTLAALLVAVDRSVMARLATFARLFLGRMGENLKHPGLLSEQDVNDRDVADSDQTVVREIVARATRSRWRGDDVEALLLRTEERFRSHRRSLEFSPSSEDGMLARRGIPTLRTLVGALLRGDTTFKVGTPDDFFKVADANASDVDFLVTGHTHLRKALLRPSTGGVYFNSGTWADLLRVPKLAETSDEELDRFVDALERDDFESYVRRAPTVVVLEGDGPRGHLAKPVRQGDGVTLSPIKNTQLAPRRSE